MPRPTVFHARMLGVVVAGGVVGVAAREILLLAFSHADDPASLVLPAATMVVNVVGSFLLGVVVESLGDRHPLLRAFVGTGILGGFTTYSAFAVQTATLLGSAPVAGVALALVSVLLGLGSAALGVVLAGRLRRGRDARGGFGGRAMNVWVLIGAALAGGLGAGLRYVVDVLVVGPRPGRFPVGIFLVNITGSFVLGVLTGMGTQILSSDAAWIIGVGLLGGYTTFSTVSVESALLVRSGEARRGWVNALGTLVAGVIAAAGGLALGGLLVA